MPFGYYNKAGNFIRTSPVVNATWQCLPGAYHPNKLVCVKCLTRMNLLPLFGQAEYWECPQCLRKLNLLDIPEAFASAQAQFEGPDIPYRIVVEVANTDRAFCKVSVRSTEVLGDERSNARLRTLTEQQQNTVVDVFRRYLEEILVVNLTSIRDLFQV